MVVIKQHPRFREFIEGIVDQKVKAAILARLTRLSLGNPGDHVPLGRGVWELRIHLGAGWRVYYAQVGGNIVLLLGGGTKKSQRADIDAAIDLADSLRLK